MKFNLNVTHFEARQREKCILHRNHSLQMEMRTFNCCVPLYAAPYICHYTLCRPFGTNQLLF